MPGRPPTPIALHKSRGTYRKGRHEGKQPASGDLLGAAPTWFTALMKAEWRRLAKLPQVKAEHRTIVEHACVLYDRFVRDAQAKADADGNVFSMKASERQTFHSVYMQLGCTPASQAKIHAPAGPKAEDPWAALG